MASVAFERAETERVLSPQLAAALVHALLVLLVVAPALDFLRAAALGVLCAGELRFLATALLVCLAAGL